MSADEANPAGQELRVGDWLVDPALTELRRDGEVVRLEPKALEVLGYLAHRPGKVVAREELLCAIWPGVVVGDDALTQAIIKLRKALGDDAYRPKYIETISKRGYRLIAPVRPHAGSIASAPTAFAPGRRGKRRWVAICAALLVLAGLAALGIDAWRRQGTWPLVGDDKAGAPAMSLPVIAVLPLANLSGDPKRDYFSDGLTDDIITALGRYSGLRVISRNSVENFRSRPATLHALKNDLGARYVVKGSVREAEGRVRVAIELSETDKGVVLGSERFEGAGRDVFEIQDRIVRNIVGALAVKVSHLEMARSAAKPPEDLEAYDTVLRARALIATTERSANRQARALLAKVLEKSPGYAEAHVAQGNAEVSRSIYGWMEDPAEGIRAAEWHARQALGVGDPGSNARAHGLLARVYTIMGKFEPALAEADRAIELNPSDANALDSRGATLLWQGRIDEAITSLETCVRFNPLGRGEGKTVGSRFNLAIAYYMAGRLPEALAEADASLLLFGDAAFVHAIRAVILAEMGNLEEARKSAEEVRRRDPLFQSLRFGDRFGAENYQRLQQGLRKAGL